MIKYKYLSGLLILSLGACQSGPTKHAMSKNHMDHMMIHKENSKHPTTLEEFEEWKREGTKRTLIKKKAFEKGDYATAFNFAIEDNQKTKGFTLNAIGTMYHFGYGVEVDYKRAKDLYERALEYGNGEAANHLGRLYINGEGVEVDYKRATEYYKLAVIMGAI